MSFQAYLDNIEQKTGKTPEEFIAIAKTKGFDSPDTKAGAIIAWLKEDFDLGRGHAMAIVHIIKNGPQISDKHVGSKGAHSDPTNKLELKGKQSSKLQIRSLSKETYSAASDLLLELGLDTREEINHHLDELKKYYVALVGGVVIGVIGWYQDNVNYAKPAMGDKFPGEEAYWVGFFGVDDKYQGQGIGSKLINFLQQELKAMGAVELWVSSVQESTTYYEAKGFERFMSGSISGRPRDFLVKRF